MQMGGVWGWRGILGQISPAVFSLMGEFFYKVVPEGVGLMVVTLGMNEPSKSSELERALADVEQAARRLAQMGPDIICLAGEPLIVSRGFGFDKEIIERLQAITGVTTTTGITVAIDAMKALHLKKIAVVSPSNLELDRRKKEFLEASGFEVLYIGGPDVPKNSDRMRLPMHIPYIEAKKALLKAPEADGIYIPCGAWPAGPQVVELLERDLGKPVITSQQAFIWAGLKALKVKEPVKGFGRLFQVL